MDYSLVAKEQNVSCKSIKGENEIIKRNGDSVIEFLDEIKLYRGLENPEFNSRTLD